ncbi:1-(5-phosphoribosyl)-5-[(5-phosphoribosylamino)methylideneamino]imidazole-4-carboxamide isomerase [Maricaulaceae bacterium NA33B04]|nr:1-(5-phosphoribosyl)-5-[(5-phosphoribosylamino)methylideneamino]imidazole-4-carboxamide isomerase [Maricaulaceae bacterium NA33B04]
MIIYPAIDVLDGRVVRLAKGDFDAVTDYGGDPVAAAEAWKAAGAEWLHLVDLSGARDGKRRQQDLVAAITATGLKVQTGGGVRSERDVEAILEAGASRVVVGSLAVSNPHTVIGWIGQYGAENLAAAFDIRLQDGIAYPTLKGWTEQAPRTLVELLADYKRAALAHALVTDVDRDGMLQGPNFELYADLATVKPDMNWQASGGVSCLDDVKALKAAGLGGVIIGRALFEGKVDLAEALSC